MDLKKELKFLPHQLDNDAILPKYIRYFNKKEFMDIFKIADENIFLNIIITGRGYGKDFGAKELIKYKWEKFKEKSIWLFNSFEIVKVDIPKFIANNVAADPKSWKDYEMRKDGLYCKKTDTLICLVTSLYKQEFKGSRDSSYKYIFYNEFNEYLTRYRERQHLEFDKLLHSLRDRADDKSGLKQIFMFANNVSIDVPILFNMGILYLEKQSTIIYKKNGEALCWVLAPKKMLKDATVDEAGDNFFELSNLFGTAEHVYSNEAIWDNMNGVEKEIDLTFWIPFYNYKIKEMYFLLYNNGDKYFLKHITKPNANQQTFTMNSKQTDIQIIFNNNAKAAFLYLMENSKITFDSLTTKKLLIASF